MLWNDYSLTTENRSLLVDRVLLERRRASVLTDWCEMTRRWPMLERPKRACLVESLVSELHVEDKKMYP